MGTILLYLGVIVLTMIVYVGMEWSWMGIESKLTHKVSSIKMNYLHMAYVGVWLISYGVLMGLFIDSRTIFALIGGLFAIPITDELKKYKNKKTESYSY